MRRKPEDSSFLFSSSPRDHHLQTGGKSKEAMFGGESEVDESYFGGRRKGNRGRGAAEKISAIKRKFSQRTGKGEA
jgi:hypothetical protein